MNTILSQSPQNLISATFAASEIQTMSKAIAESKRLAECDLLEIVNAIQHEWKLTSATVGHKFDVAAFQIISEEMAGTLRAEFKHLRIDEFKILAAKGRAMKFGKFDFVSPRLFYGWCEDYMKLEERAEAHQEAHKPKEQEVKLSKAEHEALNWKALRNEIHNPSNTTTHTAAMLAAFMDFAIRKRLIEVDAIFQAKAISHFKAILATKCERVGQCITHEEKTRHRATVSLNQANVFTRQLLEKYNPSEIERKVFESIAIDAKAELFNTYRETIAESLKNVNEGTSNG